LQLIAMVTSYLSSSIKQAKAKKLAPHRVPKNIHHPGQYSRRRVDYTWHLKFVGC